MSEPRIVFLDIETLPNQREVMKHFTRLGDYPGLTLKASINSIICCGYKVLGEKKIHCINAWDYKEWRKDVNDDSKVVKEIYEILKDADCIITHNGKRFDWKFIQTRLLYHGLPPLSKVRHIDTCAEAKRCLFMFNNRLGTISKFLTGKSKLENGGWDLWCDVMDRKPKALLLMERYCKQDVEVLEGVFKKLRPFITQLPNYNHFTLSKRPLCPTCGSTRLFGHGHRMSASGKNYFRQLCNDCGSICQTQVNKKIPKAVG
jgi:DNA polymerase elongation subunit (family B)